MRKKLLLGLLVIPFIANAQFTQNFDAATTIPAGWTVLNGGDSNTWDIVNYTGANITAYSGTNTMSIGYSSTAHSDYLVTPAITVTAGVSDALSFYARSRDPQYPETISVKISTTTPTAAAFTTTLAASVAPASGANFYKYTYNLSAYVGQTIYIGFYSATTDMFYFDLDDISVGAASTLAVNDNAKINADIKVYPNPVKDVLNINADKKLSGIEIFSLSGQLLKKIDEDVKQVNVSDLTKGAYLLKVKSDGKDQSFKIVKD